MEFGSTEPVECGRRFHLLRPSFVIKRRKVYARSPYSGGDLKGWLNFRIRTDPGASRPVGGHADSYRSHNGRPVARLLGSPWYNPRDERTVDSVRCPNCIDYQQGLEGFSNDWRSGETAFVRAGDSQTATVVRNIDRNRRAYSGRWHGRASAE